MTQNITIKIPILKAKPEVVAALQSIAETISEKNLIAVAKKCTKLGDDINGKLDTGLSFI
ncbi:MAG: hypothetical protein PSX81_02730 [bacterium]|nr:hypothetical protein [bacterium]